MMKNKRERERGKAKKDIINERKNTKHIRKKENTERKTDIKKERTKGIMKQRKK